MQRLILWNVDVAGCARGVLAGYYKFYCATLFAGNYGTTGTIVIVIYE